MAKELTELEQIELDLKRLELEERQQALESRKIQDELARLQLSGLKSDLEMKKKNKERGLADAKKAMEDRKAIQDRCNHHTGGKGAEAIHWGQGDLDRPACIGAQVFLDDRIRLTCQRCNSDCWSDDPDRQRWAKWVELWKHSINSEMMVIGGLKQMRQVQIQA